MKRVLYALAFLVMFAASSVVTFQLSADAAPATQFQMVTEGSSPIVMSLCGYKGTINGKCKQWPDTCCK